MLPLVFCCWKMKALLLNICYMYDFHPFSLLFPSSSSSSFSPGYRRTITTTNFCYFWHDNAYKLLYTYKHANNKFVNRCNAIVSCYWIWKLGCSFSLTLSIFTMKFRTLWMNGSHDESESEIESLHVYYLGMCTFLQLALTVCCLGILAVWQSEKERKNLKKSKNCIEFWKHDALAKRQLKEANINIKETHTKKKAERFNVRCRTTTVENDSEQE